MKEEDRKARHDAIAKAAYKLLPKHGYAGTSMLRVAKAAQASNETLYRWYGNKDGLFRAMVEDNAARARNEIEGALASSEAPEDRLATLAPVILTMLLGERPVLLNRAAAADPSGKLGEAIAKGGRAQIVPLLEQLMDRLPLVPGMTPPDAAALFISLIVGDWQIRRVVHGAPKPGPAEIDAHCTLRMEMFRQLALVGA